MILLRAGNRHGAGSTPGAYSETTRPVARIRAPARGARPGSRGRSPQPSTATVVPAGLERAAVRLAVDAAREPADDDEPRARRARARACARPARRTASTRARRRPRPPAAAAAPTACAPRTKSPGGGSWIARSSGGKSRIASVRASGRPVSRSRARYAASSNAARERAERAVARGSARGGSPSRPRRRPARARSRRSELRRRAVRERLGDVLGADGGLDRRARRPSRRPAATRARPRPESGSRSTARSSSSSPPSSTPRAPTSSRSRAAATRCRTGVGRLARRSRELGRARPRHGDDEVEAVEQRSRELVPERGEPLRRARALGRRIAARAARTEVHRRDELEPRREDGPPADARDADDAVLERLAQRLERGPLELGELVEQQHAAMREADLARPRARARRRRAPRPTRCGAARGTGAS